MKAGEVVEEGTHSELMALGPEGLYRHLVMLQSMQRGDVGPLEATIGTPGIPLSDSSIALNTAAKPLVDLQLVIPMTVSGPLEDGSVASPVIINPAVVDSAHVSVDVSSSVETDLPKPEKVGKLKRVAMSRRDMLTEESRDVFASQNLPPVPFARLFPYQRPELSWYVFGMVTSLASGGVIPAFSLIYSSVVVELFKPDDEMVKGVNL